MIEVPRSALTANEIAETVEFFSFGTNDLTQTGLGMSRDDAGSFLGQYKALGILPQNPFASIDAVGIGQLVEIGARKGRSTKNNLKLGICGEHGGDPVLQRCRSRLRQLLATSRASGTSGSGAGSAQIACLQELI